MKPATLVRGCEVTVPRGAICAVVDGRPLPLPRPNPQCIVVLGDTAAPLVLVPGNHVDCDRAREGYFRFLDRMPMPAACRDYSGIFVWRLGEFGVVAVDGAKTEVPKGDAGARAATLRQQIVPVLAKYPGRGLGRDPSSARCDARGGQKRAGERRRR